MLEEIHSLINEVNLLEKRLHDGWVQAREKEAIYQRIDDLHKRLRSLWTQLKEAKEELEVYFGEVHSENEYAKMYKEAQMGQGITDEVVKEQALRGEKRFPNHNDHIADSRCPALVSRTSSLD